MATHQSIVIAIEGKHLHVNKHVNCGQKYVLPALDMAKVNGPLSVGKVFEQI